MNALEIKELNKSYKTFSLENINLTLPSGYIMGLVGENGAGKSTTIKLIMNAVSRDSGYIKVLGKDNQTDLDAIKEEVGVVLDEAYFPECITAAQLNYIMKHTYKQWDENYYKQLLNRFNLPGNLYFKEFSRGMKMKLAIAVALAHHPKLLILDEATSGLDPLVRDEILDLFLEFTRDENHSILISSHIISDLEKLCDYIAFLHKGKLVFCEEKDRLLEQYGILHCKKDEINLIPPSSIKGVRSSHYGLEVLVLRDHLPSRFQPERTSIEDIMIYLAKGEQVL